MENILKSEGPQDREQMLKQAAVKFGLRVKQLRKEAGLTQAELAERLSQWGRSYHQTTVAKLESGTRPTTLEELIPLSVALGVAQQAFFDDPSPTDLAERGVRHAEQEVLRLEAEIREVRDHYDRLLEESRKAQEVYLSKVRQLEELDPDVAAEQQEEIEAKMDLAETLRVDRWPV